MSKTASEYLVEAIYMTKAVLDGRATQLIDLARSISSADGGEAGKGMMGASFCCLIQAGSVSRHSTSLRRTGAVP